jgi:hypothetical protein
LIRSVGLQFFDGLERGAPVISEALAPKLIDRQIEGGFV